jgi:hypothetical protein
MGTGCFSVLGRQRQTLIPFVSELSFRLIHVHMCIAELKDADVRFRNEMEGGPGLAKRSKVKIATAIRLSCSSPLGIEAPQSNLNSIRPFPARDGVHRENRFRRVPPRALSV